jgi:hypothetical protein
MKFSIYLAGKIPKGNESSDFSNWILEFREVIEDRMKDFPEVSGIVYLDPHTLSVNKLDSIEDFFGRDVHMISMSDAVIVNGTIKVGAGTAQEIMIAKYYGKPVITVIPKNSHYWRNIIVDGSTVEVEYKHPFLFQTSDVVVEDFQQAAVWLLGYFSNDIKPEIKKIDLIRDANAHYIEKHAHKDEFLKKCKEELGDKHE